MTIKDRGEVARALHKIHIKLESEKKKKASLKRTSDQEIAEIIRTLHDQNAFAGFFQLPRFL
jgi:hypothetical protein